MYPVAWGETLRESAYTQWTYSEVLGLGEPAGPEETPLF